jgi:hypothetical protein
LNILSHCKIVLGFSLKHLFGIQFGLKKGKVLEEIKKLQEEKGFGDPSFPRVPNCIPHDYFVRRLGRQKPFDMYRDALLNEQPNLGRPRFEDTERENELKLGIQKIAELQGVRSASTPEDPAEEADLQDPISDPPKSRQDEPKSEKSKRTTKKSHADSGGKRKSQNSGRKSGLEAGKRKSNSKVKGPNNPSAQPRSSINDKKPSTVA